MNILAISGSLRKDSYNSALARALAELAPEGMQITQAEIGTLPLFNQEMEAALVPAVQALKAQIESADGIIFATPEYNRGIPGVLKNAIDWASRPYGKNSFAKKTVLVTGVSIGRIGTALAQQQLKDVMLYLDADVMGQPEVFLGPASEIFDEAGVLTNEKTRVFLGAVLAALASRANRNKNG